MKRVHQKILCPEDSKILFHDLSQSSLSEKVTDKEREIIGQLSTINQNISDESHTISNSLFFIIYHKNYTFQ